jgi:hypothetical protein
VSEYIIAPRSTLCRARMRLEQAEAIIAGFTAAYGRIAALFSPRAPAAKGEEALSIRRAWLRASA